MAIAIFRKCKEAFPLAEDSHPQDIAAERAADWQQELKATPKNIAKVAMKAVDDLKDRYHAEAEREEFFSRVGAT